MQRTITIAAIALVVLGLGVWAYFAFFTGGASVTVAPAETANLPVAGKQPSTTTGGTGTGAPSLAAGAPVSVSPRLVQISAGPVVPGEVIVDSKVKSASTTPEASVSYIERGSGNVFSYLTQAKTLTRINNKTIPGIQSAQWLPSGSFAFVRYLSGSDFSTINTYALASSSTSGFFLSQNLSDISVSALGVLTTAAGVNGSAVSLVRADGTHPTALFTTPLASIRASFAGKNYLVFTKPSSALDGYAFIVDTAGHFSRISGPHTGLVALASPSGKLVLVSYVQNGGAMRTELVDVATGNSTPLPVATIADKCVWTSDDANIYCGIPVQTDPSSSYPDDWYQGAAHFSDRIWKIQVTGRYAQLVLDFSQAGKGDLDATALAVNPANTVLVFVNKNDSSLWSFSL